MHNHRFLPLTPSIITKCTHNLNNNIWYVELYELLLISRQIIRTNYFFFFSTFQPTPYYNNPQVTQAMHQSMSAMSLPMTSVPMQVPPSVPPSVPMNNIPTSISTPQQQMTITTTAAASLPISSPQIDTPPGGDLVSPPLVSPSPKKPKLRVHIPEAKDKPSGQAANQQSQPSQQQDQSPDQDEAPSDSQQPMITQPVRINK
jgi:hypothetical protein